MYHELHDKIKDKSAKIGVLGLGYVGLPNAIYYSNQNYNVTGFDVDVSKVTQLNKGISYIEDVSSDSLRKNLDSGNFIATLDFNLIKHMDVIFIDVPTPIDEFKIPDLQYVLSASNTILKYITKGTLLILESTVYPTTTNKYLIKPLQNKCFIIGEDIFVTYSQERVDPSNTVFDISKIPKVIGGYDEQSAKLLEALVPQETFRADSIETAELSKLFENTFRYVNIALSNEFAKISNELDINIFNMIDAAATKPFGFLAFYPSIGIGGHCIPVDPYYLSWFMRSQKVATPLIDAASNINDSMIDYIITKIYKTFNKRKKILNGSKIAILGASYKRDVKDLRMSSIYPLSKELLLNNVDVTIYDDLVFEETINNIIVRKIDYTALNSFDAVIVLVDHSYFALDKIIKHSNIIFDTKNLFGSSKLDKIIPF